MNSSTARLPSARQERAALLLTLLTAANAALYFLAGALHLGAKIPLGFLTVGFPELIPAATVVEALIGAGLAAAGVALLVRGRSARWLVWGAYVFALVGTLFGLTVALLRGLAGPDVWVHFLMLAGLAGGFVLILAVEANSTNALATDGCHVGGD